MCVCVCARARAHVLKEREREREREGGRERTSLSGLKIPTDLSYSWLTRQKSSVGLMWPGGWGVADPCILELK